MDENKFIVKFAQTKEEKEQLYKVRYDEMIRYFHELNNVESSEEMDYTPYDDKAKSIIVIDQKTNMIVGGYRIMLSSDLSENEKFLCEEEFDITTLKESNQLIVELSRAFVKKEYRNSNVLLLIWKYMFHYVLSIGARYIVGDVSFTSRNPEDNKYALSDIYYHYGIDDSLNIKSTQPNCSIKLLEKEELDRNKAKEQQPALVKAYILFGAKFSKEYFIDNDFCSLDIFVLVDSLNYNKKFIDRILDRK
ncbi:MAG: GNAT family N-acyltransferase [Bacilli bacterium]|nr:GNAT family N-acetyltransferase [Acholeplasmataceae bacterium]MDY2902935.1 GNAT family N-acyltransferase [Bacilli bacterium]